MKTNTKSTREANLPAYNVCHVIESGSKDRPNRWHRIGAVFAHSEDEGGTLILDSLPINFGGRLVLRAPKLDAAK